MVSAAVLRRTRPFTQPRTSPRVVGKGLPSSRATARRTASSIGVVTPPSSAGPTSCRNQALPVPAAPGDDGVAQIVQLDPALVLAGPGVRQRPAELGVPEQRGQI